MITFVRDESDLNQLSIIVDNKSWSLVPTSSLKPKNQTNSPHYYYLLFIRTDGTIVGFRGIEQDE